MALPNPNDIILQQLEEDPSVIIYPRTQSFLLVENDIQLAEAQSNLEARVYPFILRLAYDLCMASMCSDPDATLECHPQFSLLDDGNGIVVIPDGALCMFNKRTQILIPVLVIEAKSLSKINWAKNITWRSPEGRLKARGSACLTLHMDQLRKQAANAFPLLSAAGVPTKLPLIVGDAIYVSLLLFDKEKEENVQRIIDEYLSSMKEQLKAASQSEIESFMQRKCEENDSFIPITQDMLPELIFYNEPLILGDPAHSYNPVVLNAIKVILDHADVALQPSWFNAGLENYQAYSSPDQELGLMDIYHGYANPVDLILNNFISEEISTPSKSSDNSGDSSWKGSDMSVDLSTDSPPVVRRRSRRTKISRVLTYEGVVEDDDQEHDTASGAGLGSPFPG
ncbi:hypothetical protein EV361DRAFT_980868 [Lentinula raphanica]|nr:hypothetical protein F5880DRAFT_1626764 [Lentinula raphanica]KAJ3973033.1 hypothetical protein EV361DRAFT_980868 [Lentinula raphanica]